MDILPYIYVYEIATYIYIFIYIYNFLAKNVPTKKATRQILQDLTRIGPGDNGDFQEFVLNQDFRSNLQI